LIEFIKRKENKYIPTNIEIVNDFIRKYNDISNPEYSILFNDLIYFICFENQIVIDKLYDKNEDIFYGLDNTDNIYKLQKIDYVKYKKSTQNIININVLPDEKVKIKNVNKEIAMTSICQHEIDLKNLKFNTNKVYDFLDQYAEIDEHYEYSCKSCNVKIDISKYLAEAKFDDKKQSYYTMDATVSYPLESYKEYENYIKSIKNLDAIIQKIAYIVNYEMIKSNDNQQRINRRSVIKDVIDLILENNKVLEKTNYAVNRRKFLEKYNIKQNDFFVFPFDDNIFIRSSKSADLFQIRKYNNVINYIIIILIINISESQILSLMESKECNYFMFKKHMNNIFGNSEIIINRELNKDKIVNYPVLCYLLYCISCFITRYNIWGTKSEKKLDPNIHFGIINMGIELINIILATDEKDISKNYKYLYERLFQKFYLKLNIFSNQKLLDDKFLLTDKIEKSAKLRKETTEFDQTEELNIIYLENKELPKLIEMYSSKRLTCPPPKNYEYLYSTVSNLSNCKSGHYHDFVAGKNIFTCKLCDQKTNINDYNPKETKQIEENIQLLMLEHLTNVYCLDGRKHNFIKNICKFCDYDRDNKENIKFTEKELIKMYDKIIKNNNNIAEENFKFIENIQIKNDKFKTFVQKTLDKMVFKFQKFDNSLNKSIDVLLDNIYQIVGTDINVNNTFYNLYDNIYEIENDFDGTKLSKPMRLTEKNIKIVDNHPYFKCNVIVVPWKKNVNYDVYFSEENKKLLGYKQQSKELIKSNKKCNIRLLYSIKNMFYYFGCIRKRIILNDIFPEMSQMDTTKLDIFIKNINMDMLVNKIAGQRFNNIKKLGMELQKYISRFKNKFKIQLTKPSYYKEGESEKLTEIDLLQYNSKLDILYYNMTKSDPINITTTNKTDKNDHIFLKHFNTIYNNMAFEEIKIKNKFSDNIINGDIVIKNDYSSNIVLNYIVDEINRLINYNKEKHTKIILITFIISLVVNLFNSMNFDVIYENQELSSFKQWLFSGELAKILSANILFEEPIDYYGLDDNKEELSEEDKKELEEQELEDEEISNVENNDFHEDDENVLEHAEE
jgi:hypothetical protein